MKKKYSKTRKRVAAGFAVFMAIGISTVIIANGFHPETAKVKETNENSDIVTVETATGNLFEFYGCEDWEIGDLCSMIMWSKFTPKVEDDVIFKVRYSADFKQTKG